MDHVHDNVAYFLFRLFDTIFFVTEFRCIKLKLIVNEMLFTVKLNLLAEQGIKRTLSSESRKGREFEIPVWNIHFIYGERTFF